MAWDARQLLEIIHEWFRANGRPPTVRELQQRMGYRSPQSVSRLLDRLDGEGLIERDRRSRGVRPRGGWHGGIPVYGTIPAGVPEHVEPSPLESLPLDASWFGGKTPAPRFALRVRGDSMTDAGILDGDLVVLEKRPARHHDIVAALIDGETTLKRLIVKTNRTWLRAENPAYPDLIPLGSLEIQGVMAGLVRRA